MTSQPAPTASSEQAHCSHRMPARAWTWAASVALAAAVSGCSGGLFGKPAAPQPKSEIHAPAFRAVTVTDADSGAPVALGDAQELVVRLSTAVLDGQEWALVDLQPVGVLAASARTFERVPRGVAVEAEGDSVWHFKPVRSGSVALRFELKRPRSLEPATQVVTYVVTVQAPASVVPVAAVQR